MWGHSSLCRLLPGVCPLACGAAGSAGAVGRPGQQRAVPQSLQSLQSARRVHHHMVCLWYAHCGGAWRRPRAGRRSPRVPHAPRPPTGSRPRSPACPRGSCSGGRPSAAPAPAGQTQSNPAGWRASDRLQSGTVARSSAPERKREGLEPYVAGSRAARTTRVAML